MFLRTSFFVLLPLLIAMRNLRLQQDLDRAVDDLVVDITDCTRRRSDVMLDGLVTGQRLGRRALAGEDDLGPVRLELARRFANDVFIKIFLDGLAVLMIDYRHRAPVRPLACAAQKAIAHMLGVALAPRQTRITDYHRTRDRRTHHA